MTNPTNTTDPDLYFPYVSLEASLKYASGAVIQQIVLALSPPSACPTARAHIAVALLNHQRTLEAVLAGDLDTAQVYADLALADVREAAAARARYAASLKKG